MCCGLAHGIQKRAYDSVLLTSDTEVMPLQPRPRVGLQEGGASPTEGLLPPSRHGKSTGTEGSMVEVT